MRIKVRYFAQLREYSGRDEEFLDLEVQTPGDLYDLLRIKYTFSLEPELIRAAVEDEFQPWDFPLTPGVTVVFIPPVAGG